MHKLFLLIFSLVVTVTYAQVSDDFSDGDFSINPPWTGSAADFIVNPAGQLQLNASAGGNSYLSTPAGLPSSDTLEWKFSIRLGFAPSSSNYARVYLASDQPDVSSPLDGVYLQFGEALSNDAVELFSQSGSSVTSVCRGQDAQIAAAFSIGVLVTRYPNGLWNVFVDPGGGENYGFSSSGNETITSSFDYVGVYCTYTSGNVQNFFFDNFYAGRFIPDTDPPVCTSLNVLSDSSVSLLFSEPVNINSVSDLNSCLVNNGIGSPVSFAVDSSDGYRLILFFNGHLVPGENYSLHLAGIPDLSSNEIIPADFALIYFPSTAGSLHDIVFSEIYFEPSSVSPLPNSEYAEIYNRTDSAVNLHNWVLTDGSGDALLPDFQLGPHDYAVIFSGQNISLFNGIHNALGVASFPALNNDTGDSLSLFNADGLLIDETVFSDATYHDDSKKNGGWSVERIDPGFSCNDENNWKASVSPLQGTPGIINSVNGVFYDNTAPFIENAWLTDSVHLEVEFSEAITEAIAQQNFLVSDGTAVFSPSNVASTGFTTFELTFNSVFTNHKCSVAVSGLLTDCSGNEIDTSRKVYFGFPQAASPGDIAINEILFDSPDGGNDYLELFNCSAKLIDLYHWTVREAYYDDETVIKEEASITESHHLLFPGDYLALSEDQKKVYALYACSDSFAMLDVKGMPDFNADEGTALIFDDAGNKIDGFKYSSTLQFPLINNPKGVSLERLDGYKNDSVKAEWHSAAASAGFGTPGYRNSQWLDSEHSNERIRPEPEVFSPDNDGYHDVLSIHYQYPATGTLLSLIVLDAFGRPVRTLLSGETVGTEGNITWDGVTDEGFIAAPGRYLLIARSYDLAGHNSLSKASCVVAVSR